MQTLQTLRDLSYFTVESCDRGKANTTQIAYYKLVSISVIPGEELYSYH